jgi:hypothetical protein
VICNVELEAVATSPHGRLEEAVLVNPLDHPGWDAQLAAHTGAWFFHGTAWARVLLETYRHVPVFAARFKDGQLRSVLPLMEVSSPWTGRRGVSLPFTDFCFPLRTEDQDEGDLYKMAMEQGRARRWRYLEFRMARQLSIAGFLWTSA